MAGTLSGFCHLCCGFQYLGLCSPLGSCSFPRFFIPVSDIFPIMGQFPLLATKKTDHLK